MSGVTDRLGELAAQSGLRQISQEEKQLKMKEDTSSAMTIYLGEFDEINLLIKKIRDNQVEVENWKRKDRTAVEEPQRREALKQIQELLKETKEIGIKVKNSLLELKDQNIQFLRKNPKSTQFTMRVNYYQSTIASLHAAMNNFYASTYEYEQAMEERTIKQLKIAVKDQKLDDAKITQIARSGQAQQLIQEVSFPDALAGVIREIEDRAKDIKQLEHNVLQIFELYRDLSTLVKLQQDSLGVIEKRILDAKAFSVAASSDLKSAEKYQRNTRVRTCMIFILGAVALLVVFVILFGSQMFNFA